MMKQKIESRIQHTSIVDRRYNWVRRSRSGSNSADDGHAVDWVQSLNFAEASVKATSYNLILLDLMLPDGNGFDFLKSLRKSGDSTPVIILTARVSGVSVRIEGLNAGADDYLVKPFDLSELSARVGACCSTLSWRSKSARQNRSFRNRSE